MIGVIKSCNINIKQEGSVTQAIDSNSSIGSIYYSETPVKIGKYKGKDVYSVVSNITRISGSSFSIDNLLDNVDRILFIKIIDTDSNVRIEGMGIKYELPVNKFLFSNLIGSRSLPERCYVMYHYTLK